MTPTRRRGVGAVTVLATCGWLVMPVPSFAQTPADDATSASVVTAAQDLVNRLRSEQGRLEWVSANHIRFIGNVEQELAADTKLFAEMVELFVDTSLLVASGNVVFAGPEGRLAASSMEFNVADGTGTFHDASGLMSLGSKADRKQFGDQDPDVYFWGKTIERIGARRYRVTRGGFTTCVQPTPRWELITGSMVLNLDDYAIARNTQLRVKGVPVFYLPVMYYPIADNDRATGFLLPTYGTSTVRGQAVSNAFFWAINRSQDATFAHDWFTRSGQGVGGEYRYVAGQQSDGNLRLYRFAQKEAEYNVNGVRGKLPATNSVEISGTAVHAFTNTIRARARVDYFSSLVTQQLYQQNLYQATRSTRLIEGGLTAAFGPLSTNALYQRNEVFTDATRSQVYGSTPRFSTSLAPQQIRSTPIYGSVNAEYAYLPYRSLRSGRVDSDSSLSRYDFAPTLRAPLSKLSFLTVNTSAVYRTTYYSRSENPTTERTEGDAYLRQYVGARADIVGPVFTRIWDLPESGFAERLKHVIEPTWAVDLTSAIANYQRAPVLSDASDRIVGGAGRFTYGVTNRLFYRGRAVDGVRGQTREFVTVGLQQTYYSNSDASRYDTTYQGAYGYSRRVDLSPVALNVRVSPSSTIDGNGRVEYDVSGRGLQVLSAGGSLSNGSGMRTSVNYSRRRIDPRRAADDYIQASTSLNWLKGRANGSYSVSWDIGRGYIQNQSGMFSYLAQCCGLQVEFQKLNIGQVVGSPVRADQRFNFGFILAGLGTFSNFFGAFGGQR